eukprot:g21726.t1
MQRRLLGRRQAPAQQPQQESAAALPTLPLFSELAEQDIRAALDEASSFHLLSPSGASFPPVQQPPVLRGSVLVAALAYYLELQQSLPRVDANNNQRQLAFLRHLGCIVAQTEPQLLQHLLSLEVSFVTDSERHGSAQTLHMFKLFHAYLLALPDFPPELGRLVLSYVAQCHTGQDLLQLHARTAAGGPRARLTMDGSLPFCLVVSFQTRQHSAALVSQAFEGGHWRNGQGRGQVKLMFIRAGRLNFDIGWVGCQTGSRLVNDGKRHTAAVEYDAARGRFGLFVDGEWDAPSHRGLDHSAALDHPDTFIQVGQAAGHNTHGGPHGDMADAFDLRSGTIYAAHFHQRLLHKWPAV